MPDINYMKNRSQGSCWFLLLSREKVSPEKKHFSAGLMTSESVVASDSVCVCVCDVSGPSGVEEGCFTSPRLYNAQILWTLQVSTRVLQHGGERIHHGVRLIYLLFPILPFKSSVT